MTSILFVTGLPRSGTKLLRDLLNNHSRISIPTIETVLIPYLIGKYGRDADLTNPDILERIIADFERSPFYKSYERRGIDIKAANHFSGMPDLDWQKFFYEILKFYGPKEYTPGLVVGDKTPGYIDHVELLFDLWPGARVVHIVRDPRDCAYSAINAWNKHPYRTADRWNMSMIKLARIQEKNHFPIHTVLYEQLISDPVAALAGICEYAGLVFEPGMENPTRASENLGDATGSMQIVGSNKRKYRKAFSSSQIKKLEEIAHEGMRLYDYEPDNTGLTAKELSRWERRKYKVHDGLNSLRFHIKQKGLFVGLRYFLQLHKQNIRE